MRKPGIGEVTVGLAVLVILIGAVLYFFGHGQQKSSNRRASTDSTVLDERGSAPARMRRHRPAAPATGPETPAQPVVDFDWRQALRGEIEPPRLPREQVEKYLERNGRSPANLLAAYHALDDTNYLKEAATSFPNDPKVQLSVLARDMFPEERRKWLDLFKASSPDNSLANYLSARDYFKNGQTEAALNELAEATRKPQFKDYAMESRLDEEELNLEAGRSPLQSRLSPSGWAADLLRELPTFKGLAQDIEGLQKQYLDAGDTGSAERLAQIGVALANRLNGGDSAKFVINQLVGMAIEPIVLQQLNQDARYDFLDGKTPKDRLEEHKQQKLSLKDWAKSSDPALLANLTEAELLSYYDRQKLYGEVEAARWLQQRQAAAAAGAPAP